jgi:hypothetical protein
VLEAEEAAAGTWREARFHSGFSGFDE